MTSFKTGKYWEILNMEAPGLSSLTIDRRKQQIHRSMLVDGEKVTWYPKLPVKKVLDEWGNLLGFIYGIIISRMIGDLDFYLCSVLQNHFGHGEVSGSSWEPFITRTRIELLRRKHGEFIYMLFQERHKIEHNKARVDERFVQRMFKEAILHTYKIGDPIQKNHLDVLATYQAIREFARDVDGKLSKLIGIQNGV